MRVRAARLSARPTHQNGTIGDMLNIGGGELLAILLIALIVLGPDKLPDAARQAGKVMREFRRISSGFQREMRDAMKDPVAAATQDRKLQNRVSFEPPAPFAAQEADVETRAGDSDQSEDSEATETHEAVAAEPRGVEREERAAVDSDPSTVDSDGEREGPDDPEVGFPSDR